MWSGYDKSHDFEEICLGFYGLKPLLLNGTLVFYLILLYLIFFSAQSHTA